jgi:hypothetical protein
MSNNVNSSFYIQWLGPLNTRFPTYIYIPELLGWLAAAYTSTAKQCFSYKFSFIENVAPMK